MMGDIGNHSDGLHLAGNLLVLAACWPSISTGLGARRAGIVLGSAALASNTIAAILIGRPVIGASGVASAALAAHLVLRRYHGRSADQTVVAALAWLSAQIIFASLGTAYAGIAWPAHLIGAALGALGAQLLRRRCISPT